MQCKLQLSPSFTRRRRIIIDSDEIAFLRLIDMNLAHLGHSEAALLRRMAFELEHDREIGTRMQNLGQKLLGYALHGILMTLGIMLNAMILSLISNAMTLGMMLNAMTLGITCTFARKLGIG